LLRIEAPMPPFLCNEDECLALSERLVDGEENPIAVIYINKFYEVQNTSR
jgi:Bacterial extracellular solute-binding protein, family 7